MENVGGTISVPYGGITIQVDYHDNDSSAYGRYFHESTETTLLFDVNLGDSAITSYIPYSNIPEFDKANVKSHLETLSATGAKSFSVTKDTTGFMPKGSQKESSSTMTEAASILLLDTLHLLRQILKTSKK